MFEACVYNVFIASPGDAEELRPIARDVILQWNDRHADAMKVVLLPKMWEKNTAPGNAPAQETINREVLDHSDLVIAIWRHLWGDGTGEEVERSIQDNSCEVMQYFSVEPIPIEHDDNPLRGKLKEYRGKMRAMGEPYYRTYSDPEDFRTLLTENLEIKVHQLMSQTKRLDVEDFSPVELEMLPFALKAMKIDYKTNPESGNFEVKYCLDPSMYHCTEETETTGNIRQSLSSLFAKGVLVNAEDKGEMDPVSGTCFLNDKKRSEIELVVRKVI